MRLGWDAPSSWPAALSEPQPHRCWAGAGESEARLWGWQMGTVFTPGSLAPRLLFLSQHQLCVKTPSDITAFGHKTLVFCPLPSPKMLFLAGPPCKNYHNLGIFLKEMSSTRANLEGLAIARCWIACLACQDPGFNPSSTDPFK